MNDNPFVSIIIPVFNREYLISNMLNSLIEQSYDNWECIIVDDGSVDNTKDVVFSYAEKDSRFQYHNRPKNRNAGGNAARNYGFELSRGELINWVDSDDKLHQDFINEKVNAFIKNPERDAVLSKTVIINDSKGIKKYEERTKVTENLLEDFISLKVSWYIPDLIWKRSFLEQQERLFDEELLKGQDRDFHIRMLIENPKITFIDKYLYFYIKHDNTITNSISEKIAWSVLQSGFGRNKKLLKKGISKQTQFVVFQEMIRIYPHVRRCNDVNQVYLKVFKHFFNLDFKNIFFSIKFLLSAFLFKIVGKGSKLLD